MISKIPNNNLLLIDGENKYSSSYENTSYINDNFDDVLGKICASMEFMHQKYVEDGYSTKNLQTTKNTVIVFAGYNKILSRANDEVKKRFFETIKGAKELGKFDFIISDRVDYLKKMEYDDWFKNTIQTSFGIWIGNGVADQNLIKTNIGFKKNNNEIPKGFGIVIKNTKTSLVKLISDGNSTTADSEDE